MTPSTMKAVWVGNGICEFKDFPVPTPGKNEILIKNSAVASNPKDWKMSAFTPSYATIEGNDVAGVVEAVGEGVTEFKKGDKVAAFTKMGRKQQYGAYAEYTVSPVVSAFHLGPKTSFEDGAALPLAYMTAAIGLFQRLSIPFPADPSFQGKPILIWGASSTVGVYAVQLSKKAGLYVIGVAGAGCQHAKDYGCDEVFDYRNKSTSELANAISGGKSRKINIIFDCVAEGSTLDVITKILKPEGGKVANVLPYPKKQVAAIVPANVSTAWTSVGDAHSGKIDDFTKKLFKAAADWMEEGEFKAQTVVVVPGGLKGVEEGLRRLAAGVSAVKLVYRIDETPGLASKSKSKL